LRVLEDVSQEVFTGGFMGNFAGSFTEGFKAHLTISLYDSLEAVLLVLLQTV
jgi:hypothetical protein